MSDASPPTVIRRLCFAAPHVVMQASYRDVAHSPERPGRADEIAQQIDWPATVARRALLAAAGFGIAEAMDTAQRFLLGWPSARRLIEECGRLAPRHGFVAGAGVDHLAQVRGRTDLIDGVVHQARFIRECGGIPILLPLPWLTQNGCGEADYVAVYAAILEQLDGPLFVHWLGAMFLPELAGYFPGDSFRKVMALDPAKVRGAKLSLLEPRREVELRRELLQRDQLLLTGDDLHFARLLLGGDPEGGAPARPPPVERATAIDGRLVALGDFSHAMLGVLDAIAQPARSAMALLEQEDAAGFLRVMEPCTELGRHLFAPPTPHYKAGLAFLAWLNGEQENALLVNHEERRRDAAHLARLAKLAVRAGVLTDPELAARRLALAAI